MTNKLYNIVYADPPWNYSDALCGSGGATKHYATTGIEALKALPIKNITANDAIIFMWATYPFLPEALSLMIAWGFTYKTIAFQWVKTCKTKEGFAWGLGRWTRGNTEPCLIGLKGKIRPARETQGQVHQIIAEPIRKHSQKPLIARDKIIKLMGDLPRIELFAREHPTGWDVWGNEAPESIDLSIYEKAVLQV